MTEKDKFQPKLLTIKGARLAFFRPKPEPRLSKDGKPKGDPKASGTLLLDPSNKDHAAAIADIKNESVRALNHRYGDGKFNVQMLEEAAAGRRQFANFHLCWGLGNDLPNLGKKLYDGFANMFYLKLSDKNRPNLLNRAGHAVVEGDPQYPYSGCKVAATTTMYTYDNESRGVNANMRTIVFMEDGPAFGGGAPNAEQEYAALGDLGNDVPTGGADPFNGAGATTGSTPASDPFSI